MTRKIIRNYRRLRKFQKKVIPHRLKIAEQILIVSFFAVLIPMVISGIVINNINQHAMRAQLRQSVSMMANMVSDEIDAFFKTTDVELKQINSSLKYFNTKEKKLKYIEDIKADFGSYSNLNLVFSEDEAKKIEEENSSQNKLTKTLKTDNNEYIVATFYEDYLKNYLFMSLKNDERQIYVIDKSGKLLTSHNYTDEIYNQSLSLLPDKITDNHVVIYGDVKNQPIAYLHKTSPDLLIIVNTTENVTKNTINDNRFKLLLAVLISGLSILIVVGLYVYYMYINIRQLFKGIIAISKGSYERRIRLLKSIFTPYEIVFLAAEFNKMASEVHKAYLILKEQNVKLEQLNEFRSNLIDTISHELRTPLTSIQGYTSRLLRTDIHIDDEMKQKSLMVIKRQSERLKRLIEDLLVIPDIERQRIRVTLEPVSIYEVVVSALTLVKNNEEKEIVNNLSENYPLIYADKDRVEQIIVNLIENAVKYSYENTKVIIDGSYNGDNAVITISNQCDKIPEDKIEQLFEKFIRLEDNQEKIVKGTGLGLFIVKGLTEAMNGNIKITSTDEIGFKVEILLPLFKQ
jgi:signal transduction histidine kinase